MGAVIGHTDHEREVPRSEHRYTNVLVGRAQVSEGVAVRAQLNKRVVIEEHDTEGATVLLYASRGAVAHVYTRRRKGQGMHSSEYPNGPQLAFWRVIPLDGVANGQEQVTSKGSTFTESTTT